MKYIKVNSSKGLVEIDTDDSDWVQQLRDCTSDKPAVIRTPKGFRTVMENMGYSSLNESSPRVDLWVSFGNELPSEELSTKSAVFVCPDSTVASQLLDTRATNVDAPNILLLQVARLSESLIVEYCTQMARNLGLPICMEEKHVADQIRSINPDQTVRIFVVLEAERLKSLSLDILSYLTNAIAVAESNPKISVDVIIVGDCQWIPNFKNIYGVNTVPDKYLICRGLFSEFKFPIQEPEEVLDGLRAKLSAAFKYGKRGK